MSHSQKENSVLFRYVDDYLGVDGDSWPLMCLEGSYAALNHSEYESNLKCIEIAPDQFIDVITDFDFAVKYSRACDELGIKTIIVSVSTDLSCGEGDGYDMAYPEGGYSLLANEVLAKDNKKLIDKYVNTSTGLFKTIEDLYAAVEEIGDENDVDFCMPLKVKKMEL